MEHNKKNHFHSGTTLLDTVLALFVLGFMVILVGTFAAARETNQRTLYRAQAAALADEQLNALRRLDVTSLTNQTDGAFKNALYNSGAWSVATHASAGHSAPNTVVLARSSISNTSGRLLFPAGRYGNATFEAKMYLVNDSPANAAFGYLFRMTDSANGYRLRFARTGIDLDLNTGATQNVMLEKLINGTATRIDSRAATIAVDTWYTIRATTNGSDISLYLNGTQLGSGPFTDASHATGAAALLGWNGAHLLVDDVQTITTSTSNWNFDSSTDLPAAWIRFGLNDLPDNTPTVFDDNGTLTLSTFPVGSGTSSLKQATITIRWLSRNNLQTYTVSGLLGRSGVGL